MELEQGPVTVWGCPDQQGSLLDYGYTYPGLGFEPRLSAIGSSPQVTTIKYIRWQVWQARRPSISFTLLA